MQAVLEYLLGAKEDQAIGDEIESNNMRTAQIAAGIYVVLDLVLLIVNAFSGKEILLDSGSARQHIVAYVLLMVAFVLGLVASTLYRTKTKVKNPKLMNKVACYLTVLLMIVTAMAFGLYAMGSSSSTMLTMMIFVVLELLICCFFVFKPYVLMVIMIATGAIYGLAFVTHFGKMGPNTVAQYVLIIVIIYLIGCERYAKTIRLIKDRCEYESLLKKYKDLAYRDEFTGLHNSRALEKHYEGFVNRDLHVIQFEIDGFKFLQDNYGRDTSIEIIQQYAAILIDVFGETSTYRIENSQFLVVLIDQNKEELLQRIELARELIAAVDLDGTLLNLTVSAGYVYSSADNLHGVKRIFNLAYSKLIEAKRIGNRVISGDGSATGSALVDSILEVGRLYREEEIDQLTGVTTRSYFNELGNQILKTKDDRDLSIICLYFDLSALKPYNDKYGYKNGDQYLRMVAQTIQEEYPDRLVSRISGDRFAAITYITDVESHVQSILAKCKSYKIEEEVRIYIGMAEVDDNDQDVMALCEKAHKAAHMQKTTHAESDFTRYDEAAYQSFLTEQEN